MSRTVAIALSLLFFAPDRVTIPGAQTPARVSLGEAKNSVGEVATVCGVVKTYSCKDEGTVFNLDGPEDRAQLRILIPKANRRVFGGRLEDRFDERRACATGRIERHESRYQIVVTEPSMLALENGTLPPLPTFAPDVHHWCDPDVTLPKLRRRVNPRYTLETFQDRIQGTVLLQAVVEPTGRVGAVRVARSLVDALDREAVTALQQWQFEPGTYLGRPASVIVSAEFSFSR